MLRRRAEVGPPADATVLPKLNRDVMSVRLKPKWRTERLDTILLMLFLPVTLTRLLFACTVVDERLLRRDLAGDKGYMRPSIRTAPPANGARTGVLAGKSVLGGCS